MHNQTNTLDAFKADNNEFSVLSETDMDAVSGGIIPFAIGFAVVHIGTAVAKRIICC